MAVYLKDIIAQSPDGILTAKVKNIGPIEQNKNGKDLRKIAFFFPSTGKEMTEGVFNFNFGPKGNLGALKVGDSVEMKLEGGWPIYKIVQTTEGGTNATQNNTQQVKTERIATEAIEAEEKKWRKIDTSKILYGYLIEGYKLGKSPVDAAKDAEAFYVEQLNLVEKLTEGSSPVPSEKPLFTPEQIADLPF